MPLSVELFGIVLLAAFLHALWNTLVKSRADRLSMLAAVNTVGMLIALAMLPLVSSPAPGSWPFIGLSVLLHAGYFVFLVRAYEVGDLSHVYPLARGAAPLLVALGALLLAGETLPGASVAGVLVACIGITSLAFEDGAPWRRDAKALYYALGTSAFIAAYTVTDGMGVRRSGSAAGYIAWLFFLDGWLFGLYAVYRQRARALVFVRIEWRSWLAGGIASILAYGLVIYAMSLGAMAVVSALRETSVIFASLAGVWFLGERFTWQRIGAAVAVTAGVGIMQIAR